MTTPSNDENDDIIDPIYRFEVDLATDMAIYAYKLRILDTEAQRLSYWQFQRSVWLSNQFSIIKKSIVSMPRSLFVEMRSKTLVRKMSVPPPLPSETSSEKVVLETPGSPPKSSTVSVHYSKSEDDMILELKQRGLSHSAIAAQISEKFRHQRTLNSINSRVKTLRKRGRMELSVSDTDSTGTDSELQPSAKKKKKQNAPRSLQLQVTLMHHDIEIFTIRLELSNDTSFEGFFQSLSDRLAAISKNAAERFKQEGPQHMSYSFGHGHDVACNNEEKWLDMKQKYLDTAATGQDLIFVVVHLRPQQHAVEASAASLPQQQQQIPRIQFEFVRYT